MSRKTSTLYAWAHRDTPVAEVIKMIEELPPAIQGWAGRLVWWDRYSEMETHTPGFEKWLNARNEPDPDPLELTKTLVGLGYTERYAAMRAGLEAWSMGPRRQPLTDVRKHPEGTVFPVDIGKMRVAINPVNKWGTWSGYVVRRRKNNAKRLFSDYFLALDYAMDQNKKLEEAAQ